MDGAAGFDEAEIVDTALDLLSFDTGNPPGDTRDAVEYVEEFLQDLDVDTRRVEVEERKPNVVARMEGDSDRCIVYEGHLDTVPFDDDLWTKDPLGERDGDVVYGRGANDMKGAVSSMLHAVRALTQREEEPPLDVVLALVSGEEVADSAGLPAVVDSGLLDCAGCVVGETTCEQGVHSVTVADRGSIWLTLEARGVSAHGSRPTQGVNAVEELYRAYEDVESYLTDRDLDLPEEVVEVVDETVRFYRPRMSEEDVRLIFEHPTVNLGVFEGGDSVNTVPDHARAEVDIRLTAGVDTEEVLGEVREVLERHQNVTLEDVSWSEGTFASVDSAVVEAATEVAEEVVGERVYRRSATGGGDAKNLRRAGVPTAEFALGTDSSHAVDEHTTVDALRGNAEFYFRLPQVFYQRLDV